MTEQNKAFIVEMRANAGRTGNKRIEDFLRTGASRVQEICTEYDAILAENNELKAKNADLRDQCNAWRALVDSYNQRFDSTPASQETVKKDTKNKRRARYDYNKILTEFACSNEVRRKIQCEKNYENTEKLTRDSNEYRFYHPRCDVFMKNIRIRQLPMMAMWDKKFHCIYLVKLEEPDAE